MCKAKADGGTRCAFHATQGVQTGMTAYAASITGLSGKEARSVYTDLEAEGRYAPDPTRLEVDSYLSQAQFRARHEPSLSEAKRVSICARLGAAVGRALPNGAQFHAWKNIVAEAWARSRRKVAVAFLVGSMSFGIGACGSPSQDHTPPSSPISNSISALPAPASSATTADVKIEPGNFSGPAVDKYGADNVSQGYRETTEYAAPLSFQPKLLPVDESRTAADFAAPLTRMTPTGKASFSTTLDSSLKGDPASMSSLQVIQFSNVGGTGSTFARTGPMVVDHTISSPTAALDSHQRLAISYTESAQFRIETGGQTVRVPISKQMTVFLVPSPAGSAHNWDIDGFSGTYKLGTAGPDA